MSDIDFLANQKKADDQEPQKKDDKKEKIIWSEPEEEKSRAEPTSAWLSFLNKKKETDKPALAPKSKIDKPGAASGGTLDKDKIRRSRQEILQLIKNNENSQPRENTKTGQGVLSGLAEKFKRPPGHKQILIDYQQVFNQEKAKRNLAAERLGSARFAAPVSSAAKPSAETKPMKRAVQAFSSSSSPRLTEPNQPAAAFKDNFFSRLFKMIKDKLAAANRPKKPARTGAAEVFQMVKSEFIKPAGVKPARLAETTPYAPTSGAAAHFKTLAEKPEAKQEERIKTGQPQINRPVKPEIAPLREARAGAEETKAKTAPPRPSESIQAEAPRVLETNLIKGEIITFFDWRKKISILVNALLIPVFSIAVIYLGLMYFQKQSQAKIKEQNKKYNELTAEIKQAEVGLKEITEFQARLKTVSQIFAKHLYWTNFFNFLEENTIADVYYSGFSGDTSGNYKLDAMTAKFSSIAEQIETLRKNEKVTGARTVGGEYVSGDASNKAGVKFTLDLSILNNIFTE